VGALVFRQTDAFEPPVIASYQAKMPNEWHVTVETNTRSTQQDFLTLLYPWRAAEAAAVPASQTLPAAKGYALKLTAADVDEIVLMAREAEKQVAAAGWTLDGMAARFASHADALHFTLIEATRLRGPLGLQASLPISLEGIRTAQGVDLAAKLGAAVTLQINPGFVVKRVIGAQSWQQAADGGVTLKLVAGPVQVRLEK